MGLSPPCFDASHAFLSSTWLRIGIHSFLQSFISFPIEFVPSFRKRRFLFLTTCVRPGFFLSSLFLSHSLREHLHTFSIIKLLFSSRAAPSFPGVPQMLQDFQPYGFIRFSVIKSKPFGGVPGLSFFPEALRLILSDTTEQDSKVSG